MAPLSERQQTADAIAYELRKLGCWAVSPLPLHPDNKLRFEVLDEQREAILAKVSSWGWSFRPSNASSRFMLDGRLSPSTIYEMDIRVEQPIGDDRTIKGEIGRKERDPEAEAMLKHLGYLK